MNIAIKHLIQLPSHARMIRLREVIHLMRFKIQAGGCVCIWEFATAPVALLWAFLGVGADNTGLKRGSTYFIAVVITGNLIGTFILSVIHGHKKKMLIQNTFFL